MRTNYQTRAALLCRLAPVAAAGFAFLGTLPATGAAAGAPGEGIIRWGGGAGPNMVSAATNLPADPGAAKPLWELKLGTRHYSIPTIDRGRMYLALNDAGLDRPGVQPTGGGLVMCVDQATGKRIWQLPCPRYMPGVKPPYHFDQWNCGICSGPLVEGERVYVVGNRGEVLCLDRQGQANGNDGPVQDELQYMGADPAEGGGLRPDDGDILWRYNLITELGVVLHDVCGSTPLVADDWLFVATSNGIDDRHNKIPKPEAPSLVALDKKTGRLAAVDDEKIGRRLLHAGWSSPSAGRVNGRTLVFFGGGDGILYAFELPKAGATGAVLKKAWSADCNPADFRVRNGQPVAYSKHNQNSPDGPSEVIGTPVFHEGRVYVTLGQSPLHGNGRGCLTCVDAATGAKIWASEKVERTLATVAVAGGYVYVPDCSGNLHCLSASAGQPQWVHALGAKAWCASAFVADGKVYASTEAGVLWVLKAGPEKEVLSRTRFQSYPSTPAAADGVLYLPVQRGLMAIPGPGGRG